MFIRISVGGRIKSRVSCLGAFMGLHTPFLVSRSRRIIQSYSFPLKKGRCPILPLRGSANFPLGFNSVWKQRASGTASFSVLSAHGYKSKQTIRTSLFLFRTSLGGTRGYQDIALSGKPSAEAARPVGHADDVGSFVLAYHTPLGFLSCFGLCLPCLRSGSPVNGSHSHSDM